MIPTGTAQMAHLANDALMAKSQTRNALAAKHVSTNILQVDRSAWNALLAARPKRSLMPQVVRNAAIFWDPPWLLPRVNGVHSVQWERRSN